MKQWKKYTPVTRVSAFVSSSFRDRKTQTEEKFLNLCYGFRHRSDAIGLDPLRQAEDAVQVLNIPGRAPVRGGKRG